MNRKWLLLDCNYLCHRAKHTMGDLSFEGNATGVIYGFLCDVVNLQERFRTPHVVFCWDSKYSIRQDLFPAYKSHRKEKYKTMTKAELKFEESFRQQMIKLRKKYLPIIGFKNNFVQFGLESDDVIASICKNLPKGDEAVIVSSDHDLFQLISPRVSMFSPANRKILNVHNFIAQYKIHPHQWATVKAVAGCSSDNVPGIKGVGEKTAIKYMKGQLKKTSKAFKAIESEEGQKIIMNRNNQLVSLPFKGTYVFNLREDKLSKKGWDKVIKNLGMKSLRKIYPMGIR